MRVVHHMRKAFVIILSLIGFLAVGLENNLNRIENEFNYMELNSPFMQTDFNWVELTGIIADGGEILKI